MARQLPAVNSLEACVQAVIRSNEADGYRPVRFKQRTRSGNAPTNELLDYLSRLVLKKDTQSRVDSALSDHPNLLTVEDFLQFADWSQRWGFGDEVINRASRLSRHYDAFVGFLRWMR